MGGTGCALFLLSSQSNNSKKKNQKHFHSVSGPTSLRFGVQKELCASNFSVLQFLRILPFHCSFVAFTHTHTPAWPLPPLGRSHFPVVTEKGRRSCLLMAPGACGSRLANQCESTSGTSLGQTISLSAHSACCQSPVALFRPVPKQAGTPRAAVHAHTPARHFPKHSQSSWHLGALSPFYPPTCSTNIPEGQRAGVWGDRHCPFCRHSGLGLGAAAAVATLIRSIVCVCVCNLLGLFDCIPCGTHKYLFFFLFLF